MCLPNQDFQKFAWSISYRILRRKLIFYMPSYFDPTRRIMQKWMILYICSHIRFFYGPCLVAATWTNPKWLKKQAALMTSCLPHRDNQTMYSSIQNFLWFYQPFWSTESLNSLNSSDWLRPTFSILFEVNNELLPWLCSYVRIAKGK